MVKIKKILAVLLAVCILSLSVGSSYFDSRHMTRVNATSIAAGAGLTAGTLFQICLFVGAVVGTCYVVCEVMDNQEEIARAGKNFIDSVTEIPEGWILNMTDASGQEYVFGSEALVVVQSVGWDVIQGGGPSGDNNNNDDDDDKKGWIDLFSPANQMVGSFTALGATWFVDAASKLYQKWVNNEELTPEEQAVIESFDEGSCNQYDVAAQWSGEPFGYSLHFCDCFVDGSFSRDFYLNSFSSTPVCASYVVNDNNFVSFVIIGSAFNGYYTVTQNGNVGEYSYNNVHSISFNGTNRSVSFSANFPVFASGIAAQGYLEGTIPVTDALNYAKVYREADWLSDDWTGVLIDPLTDIALSLSQLVDLAKALGLHAVGNNLSPLELSDLIRESLPAVNPDLLPDEVGVPAIVPNPDLDPIYYPYAGAHPVVDPTPTPNPDPNPKPDPDPSPGTETDMDANDYKVDLTSIFPFCIPFDFVALLKVLDADPVAPRFEIPVVIPALNYRETVILDMSVFDDVARIIRICENVSFIIFLMFATSKVIRW